MFALVDECGIDKCTPVVAIACAPPAPSVSWRKTLRPSVSTAVEQARLAEWGLSGFHLLYRIQAADDMEGKSGIAWRVPVDRILAVVPMTTSHPNRSGSTFDMGTYRDTRRCNGRASRPPIPGLSEPGHLKRQEVLVRIWRQLCVSVAHAEAGGRSRMCRTQQLGGLYRMVDIR